MSTSRACRTGKRRFPDEGSAKKALTKIRQTGDRRAVTPKRAYRCEHCRGWHLTHQDEDTPAALRRGAELPRADAEQLSRWRRRSKRLKPMSDKRRAEGPEREAVREAVFERDGHRCRIAPFVPDEPCHGPLTPHHLRKASAQGAYSLDNLVTACSFHNDWVEMHPSEAAALGLVQRDQAGGAA